MATLALTDTPTLSSAGFAASHFRIRNVAPTASRPDTQVAAGPNNIIEVTNIVGRFSTRAATT